VLIGGFDVESIGAVKTRELKAEYEAVAAEHRRLQDLRMRFPGIEAWGKLADLAQEELRKVEIKIRKTIW
jgi:hypothetical protein